MRALLLTTSLGLLAGCLEGDYRLDLGDQCFIMVPGGLCLTRSHPFDFNLTPTSLAEGGEVNVDHVALDTLTGFDVISERPEVLTVENRGGVFVMHAVRAGAAVIAARAADGKDLDERSIFVEPIASVAFAFRPAGDLPLAELAALPGAREKLRVLPRSSGNVDLAGADKLLALGFTGELSRIDPMTAQTRNGSFELFSAPVREPGFEIGVSFGTPGAGSITASVGGVELGALPVEVIPAASDVLLRASDGTTVTNNLLVVGLVGTTPDGLPVAGLVGDFAATPPDLVTIYSPQGRGEVLVGTGSTAGNVTISAALPDRTVSTSFTIRPR